MTGSIITISKHVFFTFAAYHNHRFADVFAHFYVENDEETNPNTFRLVLITCIFQNSVDYFQYADIHIYDFKVKVIFSHKLFVCV